MDVPQLLVVKQLLNEFKTMSHTTWRRAACHSPPGKWLSTVFRCRPQSPQPPGHWSVDQGWSHEWSCRVPPTTIRVGIKKSQAEGPSGGRKRRRVQLRRGAIQKRIKILGQEVQELKREFLAKCPYITLIIDEGNNWSKTCPLYVAVLACSGNFECRIMFIGQVSSFVLDFYYLWW